MVASPIGRTRVPRDGLGIKLTKKGMEHARKYGYKTIYLDTTDALPYHLKLEWKVICIIDYLEEPDIIMAYDLSGPFPKISKP